jgi:hypothetical protein
VIQRSHLIATSLLVGCFALQGCGSVKKTLGIDRDAPDEFAVTPSIQPLDMPPDFFVLPQPNPGAPRPQDIAATNARSEQFLGAQQDEEALSPGQEALLEMAGAEENQDKIAAELDKESNIERAKGKPILESLGIKKKKGDVINAHEESIRLQEQGIPQNKTVAQ